MKSLEVMGVSGENTWGIAMNVSSEAGFPVTRRGNAFPRVLHVIGVLCEMFIVVL